MASGGDEPWRAAVERLDRVLGGEETAGEAQRFSWAVRELGGRLEVELWAERRNARGVYVQRRRVTPSMIASGQLPPGPLEADRRAVACLEAELEILKDHGGAAPRGISEATARKIVLELAGHPHVFSPLTVRGHDPGVPLEIEVDRLAASASEDPGGSLRLELVLESTRRPRPDLLALCRYKVPGNLIVELDVELGRAVVIELPEPVRRALHALGGALPPFPREARLELLERLPALERVLPVLRDRALAGAELAAAPALILRVAPLGRDSIRVSLWVRPAEGLAAAVPGTGGSEAFGISQQGALIWAARDLVRERALAAEVIARFPPLARRAGEGIYGFDLSDEEALDLLYLLEREEELETEWSAGVWRPTIHVAEARDLRLVVRERRDWFGVSGGIDYGQTQLSLAVLLEALREDRRHVRLDGEQWVRISETLAAQLVRVQDLLRNEAGEAVFGPAAPLLLADLEFDDRAAPRWAAAVERIEALTDEAWEPPATFTGALRGYQLDGFRWLCRLAELGFGACLADDMGLGKTIQAIALLARRGEKGPQLVVAPTSVGENWLAELDRFAPALRPLLLRTLRPETRAGAVAELGPGDVLIASYELVLREINVLQGQVFSTLVLDEAQSVKNYDTDRARAVRRLEADFRVALTGTPVENHAGELWSLFQNLVPGLLGDRELFRQRFLLRDRRAALSRLIRPFVLRRSKAEVARELPPKTEIELRVALAAGERQRYHEARLSALAALEGSAEALPEAQRRFAVLAALTQLRQLACHPRLVDPDGPATSSKLEAALRLIRELSAEGHRALVFSQFTRLLDLFEIALTAESIGFERLDGQTPARQRALRVRRFQEGTAQVFLLSLKVGGTGLNLTAADYVLILDPWWNPAAEDQASDRAHRIGQDRAVTVYRLIAQGTIEEEMLAVHRSKRELVRGLLDGAETAGQIGSDALIALIRGGAASSAES